MPNVYVPSERISIGLGLPTSLKFQSIPFIVNNLPPPT
nr:MAG TPA: hypothetical protein [Caudoviricetes sp.]DAN52753.1 MAG TPA: hypothetical protein [Caudoviricetes sp.]